MLQTPHKKQNGFTIVELLIVIVVIAILAAISIVAYRGIQDRAIESRRNSDMSNLLRAITLARTNTGQSLGQITGSFYSIGTCSSAGNNPNGTEPKDLPKSHSCWVRYYNIIDNLGAAAEMNLSSLRAGDPRGNPYMLDENEGEHGDFCRTDSSIRYFTGNSTSNAPGPAIPKYFPTC